MAWCSGAEVANLILVGRLRPDVSAEARKQADLAFLRLCAESINIGDVLVELAASAGSPPGVRLNAALAVEPLFQVAAAWAEGLHFSDKDLTVRALVASATAEAVPGGGLEAKVQASLTRSLCRVIASEYPSAHWRDFIGGLASTAASEAAAAPTATRAQALLLALAHVAHVNYDLWLLLATDVVRLLLGREAREWHFAFYLALMKRRSRPSRQRQSSAAGGEAAACLLLSDEMSDYVMGELQRCVAQAATRAAGPDAAAYFSTCDTLLAIAQRLVRTTAAAEVVFRCSSFFLVSLQPPYLAALQSGDYDGVDGQFSSLAGNALECLLSVLQAYPAAAASCSADALLGSLLCFMPDSLAMPCVGDDEKLTLLTDRLTNDEAVPLGCGSGDVAALAGAVLELFLEAHLAQLLPAAAFLAAQIGALETGREAAALRWSAVANALVCLTRVCDEEKVALVDALRRSAETSGAAVLGPLAAAASDAAVPPFAAALLVDCMGQCFVHCASADAAAAFMEAAEGIYAARGAEAVVRDALLHTVGHFLQNVAAEAWRASLVGAGWLERALQAMYTGTSLGLHGGGGLLAAVLQVAPTCASVLLEQLADPLAAALAMHGRGCCTSAAAALLAQCLRRLYRAHSSAAQCAGLQAVFARCRDAAVAAPPAARLLVTRSLSDVLCDVRLPDDAGGGEQRCAACAGALQDVLLPLAVGVVAEEGQCDGGTLRSVATALSLSACSCVASPSLGPLQPTVFLASAALATRALLEEESQPSAATGAACAHLGFQALATPAVLDADMSALLCAMFRARKDVKPTALLGCLLLPSLVILRCPSPLALVAGAGAASEAVAAAWARALGWCASLVVFCPPLLARCVVAACYRVYLAVATAAVDQTSQDQPSQQQQLFVSRLRENTICLVGNLHASTSSARARVMSRASVAQALAVCAVAVKARYARTGKGSIVCQPFMRWALQNEERLVAPFLSSIDEPLASMMRHKGPVEMADALLRDMAAAGLGPLVEEATQFVNTA